jgi:uncharacterized repeat protein (TIGR03803 family)
MISLFIQVFLNLKPSLMKKMTVCFFLVLILVFLNFQAFAQPKLWGTLPWGGITESGVIYEIDLAQGGFDVVHTFIKYNGEHPRDNLLHAGNGKLYGIAEGGFGSFGSIIYEYDPLANTFAVVHDFYDPYTSVTLSAGSSSLMQASNGKIYGYTQYGGFFNDGQLFEFDPDDYSYEAKADFEVSGMGKHPVGTLCEAANGKLYGVTEQGGDFGYGVLFEYDPVTNAIMVRESFDEINYGRDPSWGVIQATNGKLYGMTYSGGANLHGVIYSYEPGTGIFTKLHDFNSSASGRSPYGRLFEASNGFLYGMTSAGGAHGHGVLFKYDPNQDIYYKLIDFDATNGAHPTASLIQYGDYLYGMTRNGGLTSDGVLFRFNINDQTLTKLHDFYGELYGEDPFGTLTLGPDGNLYGTTFRGGSMPADPGILFMYDLENDLFVKKFDFMEAIDGSYPFSDLLLAGDGWLYATTYDGGDVDAGTIYRINPVDRSHAVLFNFNYTNNGGIPVGGVTQASNGLLYGMANRGANTDGLLYVLDPSTNDYTVLFDFDELVSGQTPDGRLLQASNGNLYGTLTQGGSNGDGVLFEWNITTNTYTKLFDFQMATSGKTPRGNPVQAANGKLYGIASEGGLHNGGVLWEYDIPSGIFTKKQDFDGTNKGSLPVGTLIEFADNQLYGLCFLGGLNNGGVLFRYDADSDNLSRLVNFDGLDMGGQPMGSLMVASNNKLYGTTGSGGAYGFGVVFEFNPGMIDYNVVYDFREYRNRPAFGALVEVDSDFGFPEGEDSSAMVYVFPNPALNTVNIRCETRDSGLFDIRLINQLGQTLMATSSGNDENNTIRLDVSGLKAGIYFLRITTNGQSTVTKFVKTD